MTRRLSDLPAEVAIDVLASAVRSLPGGHDGIAQALAWTATTERHPMDTEPVRLTGWTALAVGLALLAIIGWTQGLDVPAIVGQVAVVALTSIGGLEFARAKVTPAGKL